MPGLGETDQALAAPDENLDPEFGFEFLDLLAHPRLRGEQFACHPRQIEVVLNGGADVPQLLEVHRAAACQWRPGIRGMPNAANASKSVTCASPFADRPPAQASPAG